MTAEPLQMRFARAVRRRREALGLSQEAFADKIGLHRTYVGSVERGERNVSLSNLQRIADGLDTALSVLINEAETRERDLKKTRR